MTSFRCCQALRSMAIASPMMKSQCSSIRFLLPETKPRATRSVAVSLHWPRTLISGRDLLLIVHSSQVRSRKFFAGQLRSFISCAPQPSTPCLVESRSALAIRSSWSTRRPTATKPSLAPPQISSMLGDHQTIRLRSVSARTSVLALRSLVSRLPPYSITYLIAASLDSNFCRPQACRPAT